MIRTLLLALAMLPLQAAAEARAFDNRRIAAVIDASGLSGDVQISNGRESYGHVGPLPRPYRGGHDGATWRWASVTKQMTALLVMQEVAAGRIDLDRPIGSYLPGFRSPNAPLTTVRQLLQHRSGLPNPDDTTPGLGGFPSYYQQGYRGNRSPMEGYCAGPVKGAPGGAWTYNNCDYLVLGALLEKVTGKSFSALFKDRIARPLKLTRVGIYPGERHSRIGTADGKPEPPIDLASFGASGALWGSPDDLLIIDLALLDGALLPSASRETMWNSDPSLGFMALGQWVFTAPLKGCAGPVQIVERRGAIGSIEVRNFILPEQHLAVAVFSDRAPFEFGEIWQGKGFTHDLLAAAACP